MAFTHDKDWTASATGTQSAVVPAGGIAAAALVVVFTNNRNSGPSAKVTDSRGNTYLWADGPNNGSASRNPSIWWSVLNVALAAADTITIPYGSGFGECVVSSFVADTGASLRAHAIANQGAATALSTATVGGQPQAGDLVVACWSNTSGAVAFTKGGSFTLAGDLSNSTSQISAEWKVATADGNQTADATYGAATASASVLGVFAPFEPSNPVLDLPVIYLRRNL